MADDDMEAKRETFDAAIDAIQEAAEAIDDDMRSARLSEARTEVSRVATEELGTEDWIIRSDA